MSTYEKLKGLVDGNDRVENLYTFIRPGTAAKYAAIGPWQESNCLQAIPVKCSNQLGYRGHAVVEL